jgi:hypothetical protein
VIKVRYPYSLPFIEPEMIATFIEVFKDNDKIDHIIDIFNKLLLAFNIVLYSRDKKKLISVIESFNSFLHPFEV